MKHHSQTKRFILRPFRLFDVDDFYEMEADPEVHKYIGKDPVKTKEEVAVLVQGVLDQYKKNGIGRWAVEDKITGEVVGWSGIKLEDKAREFSYYDVGYRLKKKHWGKGIATEVGLESVRYGFVEMQLDKIAGGAELEHDVSNHLLQKIGLKPTGIIQAYGKDHYWFEISREEWLKENEP